MKLKPLHDFIHLKRLDPKKSLGKILIPETAQDKQLRAEVLAAGPGLVTPMGVLIPTSLKKGDVVLLPYMRGADMLEQPGGAQKLELTLRESEIIGVVEEE